MKPTPAFRKVRLRHRRPRTPAQTQNDTMSTSASGARLEALTKELLNRWQQTRESWMDVKAREFNERYMLELESRVKSATTSIANLEAILRKVRSDCE